LVEVEELRLLLDERALAVEVVAPAVVLAGELTAGSLDSSRGKSVHTSLLPRCRQMLWNARTLPSVPRTTTTDVRAASISFVKKLPTFGSCSTRPTLSQVRAKIASRSRSYCSGVIESSYEIGPVPSP